MHEGLQLIPNYKTEGPKIIWMNYKCHSENKICHKVDELLYPRVNTRRQSWTIKVRLSTRGVWIICPFQHIGIRWYLSYTIFLALYFFKPFFLRHQNCGFLKLLHPSSHVIRVGWGGIEWTTPPTSKDISRACGLTRLGVLERKVSLHMTACQRSCNHDRDRNRHFNRDWNSYRNRNIVCLEYMCLTQQRKKI